MSTTTVFCTIKIAAITRSVILMYIFAFISQDHTNNTYYTFSCYIWVLLPIIQVTGLSGCGDAIKSGEYSSWNSSTMASASLTSPNLAI